MPTSATPAVKLSIYIPACFDKVPAPDGEFNIRSADDAVSITFVESTGAVRERAVALSTVISASATRVAPVIAAVSMSDVTCVGAVKVIVPGVKVKNVFSADAPAPRVAAEPVKVSSPVDPREK